jgi:hypothetical protein
MHRKECQVNNSDLGRVQAYLLRHRYAETKSARRNISKEERDVATMLRGADASMRTLLEEIFDGQGLELKSFNEFEAAGVPIGATVFVLARKPDFTPPFFGTEKLIARMRQVRRGIGSDAEAKIWFTQLWFILLDLLYTRKSRGPNALQDWVETSFAKNVFVDVVKEYINDHVRKIDPSTLKTDAVYKVLTNTELKEGTVSQLCNAFLELMVDAGLLDLVGQDSYRQTLLFAYEMKMNYDRQLAKLLPGADPYLSASTLLIVETESEAEER